MTTITIAHALRVKKIYIKLYYLCKCTYYEDIWEREAMLKLRATYELPIMSLESSSYSSDMKNNKHKNNWIKLKDEKYTNKIYKG